MNEFEHIKLTALIIDDEPCLLELLDSEFRDRGYNTLSACCGYEAIEILKVSKVDIILSDYRMPNGGGIDVIEFTNTLDNPPIVFFLSGDLDLHLSDIIHFGVKDIFFKPFDLDLLVTSVENHLIKRL